MNKFWGIMFFYAILSCFFGPFVFHYFIPNRNGYEIGYIIGTIVSVILWFTVGKKMI